MQVVRRRGVVPLPPDVAVHGAGHVREERVLADARHGVGVGLGVRARDHAEVAGLGIHRPQAAVGPDAHPGDVVAHGADLPARELLGRDQHGEVGLAAGRREGRGHVADLALGALGLEDEHVLGEPALLLREVGADAERQALLAEQRVAAVARAHRPDGVVLREVGDEALLGVALGDRVHPLVEVVLVAEPVEGHLAHAGHEAHVERHVDRVGDLDAHLGERRVGGAHHVGHHVHRAPLHAAGEEAAHLRVHLGGGDPGVGGAGLLLRGGADDGQVLDAGDVVLVRVVVVAARPLLLVERDEDLVDDGLGDELLALQLRTVEPEDLVRRGELGHLLHPCEEVGVLRGRDGRGHARDSLGMEGEMGSREPPLIAQGPPRVEVVRRENRGGRAISP